MMRLSTPVTVFLIMFACIAWLQPYLPASLVLPFPSSWIEAHAARYILAGLCVAPILLTWDQR